MGKWVNQYGQPAKLEFQILMDRARLVSILKQETPIGDHAHDRVQYLAFTPRQGGEYRRSWNLQNVRFNSQRTGVLIDNDLPYARAVARGSISAPVRDKLMHWRSDSGEEIYAKSRGISRIPVTSKGQRNIDFPARAVDKWFKGVGVRWKPYNTSPQVADR